MSLNYQEIVDNLTPEVIEKLLYTLGAQEVIKKDSYLISNTICHNVSDGSMKLYYYYDSHTFVCYTECGAFSPFNFLKHYYEERGISYDWYKDVYCVLANAANVSTLSTFAPDAYKSQRGKYQRKNQNVILPTYPSSILSIFSDTFPDEWLLEGITEESMEKYQIKYSISQNKIIIPHFNAKGELVGIRGRALDPIEAEKFGKYMPVKLEGQWYAHPLSLNLYGLNLAIPAINKTGRVILVEGEKSTLLCDSFYGYSNAVAVCGSNLHKTQLNLLLKHTKAREIIVAFDKEYTTPASEEGERYFEKLRKICSRYSAYYNFSFIYDREGLLDLKDSPFDRGKEVFEELLKKRVIIKE